MNKKVSLGVAIAMVIISIAATFAITMAVSQKIYNGIIEDLPQRMEMYDNLAEIDDIIHDEYYDVIDSDSVNRKIQDGYIKGLNDNYSRYLTADEYEKYKSDLDGKMSGIGVDVIYDKDNAKAYISRVYANSPALSNGLKVGDVILSVNEEILTEGNCNTLIANLNNSAESSIVVKYQRDGSEYSVSVPTGYTVEPVDYNMQGSFGYIKINMFNEYTEKQFKSAVDSITDSDAKGVVIDLRGTNGGEIEYAVKAADVAVPIADGSGAMAQAKKGNGDVVETFSSDSYDISLPIMILVDNETSGAAELFACTLRDFGKGQLVGKKTMGNATMQEVFKLEDGNVLLLTVALVEPYKSGSYHGIGLAPDYEIANSSGENDEQLQKAFTLLEDRTK